MKKATTNHLCLCAPARESGADQIQGVQKEEANRVDVSKQERTQQEINQMSCFKNKFERSSGKITNIRSKRVFVPTVSMEAK